ncbi:ATP-binding protein [Fusobacterium nucleatum]|uniref:AAA family ATPase n=1 Tax=Fusobacterium nucleatum TaxID=851 RepID=UPI0030CDDC91
MKLKSISVKGLYGYINKNINFLENETYLVGSNGSGKSSILRIIDAFFSKNIVFFETLDCENIIFEFENQDENYKISLKWEKEISFNEISGYLENKKCYIYDLKNTKKKGNKKNLETIKKITKELVENENSKKIKLSQEDMKYLKIMHDLLEVYSKVNNDNEEEIELSKKNLEKFFEGNILLSLGIEYPNEKKSYIEKLNYIEKLKNSITSLPESKIDKILDELFPSRVIKKIWREKGKEYLLAEIEAINNKIKVNLFSKKFKKYIRTINSFLIHSGKEVYFDKKEANFYLRLLERKKIIDIEFLSTGETEILNLCTQLFFNEKKIIIIDEPEKSLHLEWQILFGKIIEAILEYDNDLQIIVATHSPFIVDRKKSEKIRNLRFEGAE